jgi:arabinogalactan oligomer/maltooligosaccharide transport system permease protein
MWRGKGSDRLVVLWFGINMLFLFFWPTKWPQYILAVTVPISLAAARCLQDLAATGRDSWRQWQGFSGIPRRHLKTALIWLSPAILLMSVIVVYPLVLQTALANTYFDVGSLRDGAGGLLGAFGRGLLGLPPDPALSKPIIYSGNGSVFNLLMWEPFLGIIRFNILWAGLSMVLATILGLWLATLLHRKGVWGRQIWRTLFILPWAIPEFVGALIWSTLFDDVNGGVNNFLNIPPEVRTTTSWLGDNIPLIDFTKIVKPVVDTLNSWRLNPFGGILEYVAGGLSQPRSFWVLVLVGVWVAFPFMMLVSTVALRSITNEVVDAARVDGAKGWNMWRGITWPLIRPSIWAGVLLRGVLLFNAFHIPLMLINNNRIGENNTLANVTYLAMRFGSGYSVAALVNVVTMGVAIALIWLFNRQTRVVEGIQYV